MPSDRPGYAMVVHHDGGCVAGENRPKTGKGRKVAGPDQDARAGWGYQTELIKLSKHLPRGVPIHQRRAYGPVQLADTSPDFAG